MQFYVISKRLVISSYTHILFENTFLVLHNPPFNRRRPLRQFTLLYWTLFSSLGKYCLFSHFINTLTIFRLLHLGLNLKNTPESCPRRRWLFLLAHDRIYYDSPQRNPHPPMLAPPFTIITKRSLTYIINRRRRLCWGKLADIWLW